MCVSVLLLTETVFTVYYSHQVRHDQKRETKIYKRIH